MPHDLPPGFHPWPGTREPREEGPFQIILRGPWEAGVWTEAQFTRSEIKQWCHEGSGGDIIAVRKV